MRSQYDEENHCELHNDSKRHRTCVKESAFGSARPAFSLLALLLACYTFVFKSSKAAARSFNLRQHNTEFKILFFCRGELN